VQGSDAKTDDSSDSESDTWPEETLEFKVPVSVLLLGGNSPAFRRMLSSGLKDAEGKKQADITLSEPGMLWLVEEHHKATDPGKPAQPHKNKSKQGLAGGGRMYSTRIRGTPCLGEP